jgi:hypothetical protein
MITQSNMVEKGVMELFAKENRNKFNLGSTIFLFLEKKEEECKAFF